MFIVVVCVHSKSESVFVIGESPTKNRQDEIAKVKVYLSAGIRQREIVKMKAYSLHFKFPPNLRSQLNSSVVDLRPQTPDDRSQPSDGGGK